MLRILEAPEALPITIEEAVEHCRAPIGGSDDVLVERALKGAISFIENRTGRIIAPTLVQYRLDDWPCDWDLKVPHAPIRDVVDVRYVGEDGIERSIGDENWSWEGESDGAVISWAQLSSIPSLHTTQKGTVRVNFQAGYNLPDESGTGDDPNLALPEDLKIAILMLTSHWYENRGLTSAEQQNSVPMAVDTLINRFKIF